MRISVPGFPVQYVDEAPPTDAYVPNVVKTEVLPTAEEAMALALARARAEAAAQNTATQVNVEQQTATQVNAEQEAQHVKQVLEFTRNVPAEASPLVDNRTAVIDPGVNVSAALEHGAGVATPKFDEVQVVTPTVATPKFDEVQATDPLTQ